MVDPHTKESRGFGFVKMMTAEQADAAKEGLQGEVIDGRTLSIEKARRARPRTPTPGKYFGPPKRGMWELSQFALLSIANSTSQRISVVVPLRVAMIAMMTAVVVVGMVVDMMIPTDIVDHLAATKIVTATRDVATINVMTMLPGASIDMLLRAARTVITVAVVVVMIVVVTTTNVTVAPLMLLPREVTASTRAVVELMMTALMIVIPGDRLMIYCKHR